MSFQGICLRHSKYWLHSLNDCSARRLYIQWLVFWFNHSIWRQWRQLNIVYVQAWLRSTCWNSWMRENHVNGVLYTSGMLAFRMDEQTLRRTTKNYRKGKVQDLRSAQCRQKKDYWWTRWSCWRKLWNCLLYYNKLIKDNLGISTLGLQTFEWTRQVSSRSNVFSFLWFCYCF